MIYEKIQGLMNLFQKRAWNKMKDVKLVVVVLILSGTVFSQQKDVINSVRVDSVYRYQGINPVLNINSKMLQLFTSDDFSAFTSNQLAEGDSATLWLRTKLAVSSPCYIGETEQTNNHLLLPFYEQYLENSKFDPVRYALAIAQTAAVGYMAYRHIKKYGFFK